MSKAPETIYPSKYASEIELLTIERDAWKRQCYENSRDAGRLTATLKYISRNASVMTTHGIETMARDALTKEG